MRPWGLRKLLKFYVIQCITEGVIGRKPKWGNFHQNVRGPWHKDYRSDAKYLGQCKNGTDVMRMHFGGDRWTHGDRR